MIEAALGHVLGTAAGVVALVADRVFWGDRLQGNESPVLVYRAGESTNETASGGMRSCQVEIIGIAETAAEALAIAEAGADALDDEPEETLISTTGIKFAAVSGRAIEVQEPEAGDGEARTEAAAVVSVTLYYRG